jgi:hypothetical protein
MNDEGVKEVNKSLRRAWWLDFIGSPSTTPKSAIGSSEKDARLQ